MPQNVRFRKQTSINVSTATLGTKVVQQLGRGMIYREIILRLQGTVTTGAVAESALSRGDEWSLIERIDLVVNGTDIIRSLSGVQLYALNRLMFGANKRNSPLLGDNTTTGAITVDSTLSLPLWMPLSAKPMDTALDSSKLSDLRLEITFASNTGLTGAAATIGSMSLEISSLESFGIDGKFSDCRMYSLQSVYSAANPQAQVTLPVTALYRGFIINAAAGATAASADAPTAVSNVKLISGTTVFRDIATRVMKDWQTQRINFQRQLVQKTAGAAIPLGFASPCRSSKFDDDAWYYFELANDGYLTEGIDSVGYSELYLELNVASACTVTVIPIQIFPPRRAA